AASSWPLDELMNISAISPLPSSTVRPTPSAVAMMRLAWTSPAPRVTSTTAMAAMTMDSRASRRRIRQKRSMFDERGLGGGAGIADNELTGDHRFAGRRRARRFGADDPAPDSPFARR